MDRDTDMDIDMDIDTDMDMDRYIYVYIYIYKCISQIGALPPASCASLQLRPIPQLYQARAPDAVTVGVATFPCP